MNESITRPEVHMKKKKDSFYAKYIKRILDFTLSLFALLVLSPLLLILTVVGAIAMKGNPFFTQQRPGMIDKRTGQEKIFKLIKFRTMSNAKDSNGNLLQDKERLNLYGKILRASSLDEIPEAWNVLKGDMSLIGPRPWLPSYLTYFNEWEHQRHNVRPGITGLAQVSGRNALTWKKRFEKDIEYVENISFILDLKILFLTVKKVFVHEGIEFNSTETIADYFANRDSKTELEKKQ